MIDPLGPDPAERALPPRYGAERASEFEVPRPEAPSVPKVRYANYDSPEALKRTDSKPSTALARPMPPKPGKLERAVGIARTVLPLVGRMLPLLEGNVVGAAANLLGNQATQAVDVKPLEDTIARIQADQRALAFHTGEQKRAIRQLEDEFSALQEALQKNAANQAELTEQVLKLAKRMRLFMRLIIILLTVSILFTTLLVVRIAYILRP